MILLTSKYLSLIIPLILINPESSFAQVKEEWINFYNGSGFGTDYAKALAIDSAGNVYVTGGSFGEDGTYDYATIKYDPRGTELWAKRYGGSAIGDDLASAIVVDTAGNVYVTGYSRSSMVLNSTDYATIKYDPNGSEIWVARYRGSGEGDNIARAIAVDVAGNVYVTGYSNGTDTADDYATIKYDSGGNELWVSRYNGPVNGFDQAAALAVDNVGNVYVTGGSCNGLTTSLYESYDYATIKYDSRGKEEWVARYNDSVDGHDFASAIAVDSLQNVYVTGGLGGLVFYSEDGSSVTNIGYGTIKYDVRGSVQWVARYNGHENGDGQGVALALDAIGHIYVTGYSSRPNTFYDYATIKYDTASGNELWVSRYNGPSDGDDFPSALVVDSVGDVIVTGSSINRLTGPYLHFDYATIKYDNSGNELWVSRYNGPGNGDDFSSTLAVDAAGNVFLTGYSRSSAAPPATLGTLDFVTIKLVSDEKGSGSGSSTECFIVSISK